MKISMTEIEKMKQLSQRSILWDYWDEINVMILWHLGNIQKIISRNEDHGLLKWNRDIYEYYENCYKAGFKIINGAKLKCLEVI